MHDKNLNSNLSVVMLTADRQVDRRILMEAETLEAEGWSVTILAMPNDRGMVDAPQERWVMRVGQTRPKVARYEKLVLNCYLWLRRRVPLKGLLMRWMKQLAWRFLVDQETFYARIFLPEASHYRPTVFVAHDLPLLPVACRLAARSGAKVVYDSHELYSEQSFSVWEQRRWSIIEARYISKCDVVITVNQSIASALERKYSVRGVQVIYNAERAGDLPVRSRHLHERLGLALKNKILLFQGGLSEGRSLDVLVAAMQHVRNENVVLVILGNGPVYVDLQARVRRGRLETRVYFLSAVPQRKLLSFTAAADAGVIPYQATCLNNYYCTPNKLFEFISAGLPILSSDLPEIQKIVEGRQIGLIGDTSTPEKMALLIDDFFSNKERFVFWKANLEFVRKIICWEEEKKKLIKIYGAFR
jgi:glycosyltransferase involved in cell wall biosynthesis